MKSILMEDKACLSYIISIMAVDVLVKQGTRASVAMVMTELSQNTLISQHQMDLSAEL